MAKKYVVTNRIDLLGKKKHRGLTLTLGLDHYADVIGDGAELIDCKIIIHGSARGVIISKAKFRNCVIQAKRPFLNFYWSDNKLIGCTFLGRFEGCVFGNIENTSDLWREYRRLRFHEGHASFVFFKIATWRRSRCRAGRASRCSSRWRTRRIGWRCQCRRRFDTFRRPSARRTSRRSRCIGRPLPRRKLTVPRSRIRDLQEEEVHHFLIQPAGRSAFFDGKINMHDRNGQAMDEWKWRPSEHS